MKWRMEGKWLYVYVVSASRLLSPITKLIHKGKTAKLFVIRYL